MISEAQSEEKEDAGCICQRWPMVVLALAFFVCGAVGMVGSYALLQQKSLEHKNHYGVIIDAGSSHTDIAVYRWPSDYKYNGTAKVEQRVSDICSTDGISSFKNDPEKAGAVISSCIENVALKSIAKMDWHQTPIYVGATAGMRLMCARHKTSCDQVMQAVRDALDKHKFNHNNQSARILTGKQEGKFGWVTVNLLKKTIGIAGDNKTRLFGALDMGGASVEITFIPKSGTVVPAKYSEQLRLYGNTYPLYTQSFLCYGMKEAERRLLASLIQSSNYAVNVTNPCFPSGFMSTVFAYDVWRLPCSMRPKSTIFPLNPQQEYLITGSSNHAECSKAIKSLFNETECEFGSCSFDGAYQPEVYGQFIAFAGFGFVAKFLNLTEQDSIQSLATAGRDLCKENWFSLKRHHRSTPEKYLHKYCFDAEYMHQILTYGFHFKEDSKQVTFVNQIDGIDVGWSLGFMVNATNLVPVEYPHSRISRESYILFTGLSAFVVFFSFLLCCCYSAKKLRNQNYDYRPLDYNG